MDLFHARGLSQADHPAAAQARPAFLARVARLRGEGLAQPDFLAAQEAFHRAQAPEQMAELDGIAQGFAVDFADLWLHLHAGTLSDLKGAARLEDGCSALAGGAGPDGPLLVKNRDLGGPVELVQVARRLAGGETGGLLVLGSLLAPAAYSSGMNGAGLAVADTHVAVNRHRVGWLRYLLMGHLLDHCRDVAQALEVIRTVPHCGGGTLELVDRAGATAAVELAATGPLVEAGPGPHGRANHYTGADTAAQNLAPRGPEHAASSRDRLARLRALAAKGPLTRARAMAGFATHGDAQGEGLCQHVLSRTLSCAIWSPVQSCLDWTDGPPCITAWQRLSLSPGAG